MSRKEKPAKQDRSRRTREVLLRSLEELLKERSFEQIGVVEIAENANVSTASIYRRFDKRDGLLPALFDLYLQRMEEWYQRDDIKTELAKLATQNLTLKQFVNMNIQLLIRLIRDLEHLSRPMFLYARMRPDLISDRVVQQLQSALESSKQTLANFSHEIKRKDLERSAQFIGYFFQTVPYDYILFRDQTVLPGLDITDDDFAAELSDFICGYLTMSS